MPRAPAPQLPAAAGFRSFARPPLSHFRVAKYSFPAASASAYFSRAFVSRPTLHFGSPPKRGFRAHAAMPRRRPHRGFCFAGAAFSAFHSTAKVAPCRHFRFLLRHARQGCYNAPRAILAFYALAPPIYHAYLAAKMP